jgi:hypothetical protein
VLRLVISRHLRHCRPHRRRNGLRRHQARSLLRPTTAITATATARCKSKPVLATQREQRWTTGSAGRPSGPTRTPAAAAAAAARCKRKPVLAARWRQRPAITFRFPAEHRPVGAIYFVDTKRAHRYGDGARRVHRMCFGSVVGTSVIAGLIVGAIYCVDTKHAQRYGD